MQLFLKSVHGELDYVSCLSSEVTKNRNLPVLIGTPRGKNRRSDHDTALEKAPLKLAQFERISDDDRDYPETVRDLCSIEAFRSAARKEKCAVPTQTRHAVGFRRENVKRCQSR